MPSKLTPEERLSLIKRVLDRHEKVARVCREAGISRVLFYRWLKRYQQPSSSVLSLIPKTGGSVAKPSPRPLSPQDRLKMIKRVASGEPVTAVCQDYGVSRVIFYRWKRRYDEAPEGQKLEALWDKKPQITKFYQQTPDEVEKAVLSVVIQYPELSSHKIVALLPQIGDRPVLGNHGVQNVLRRHNLTTYTDRQAYSLARRHVRGVSGRFLRGLQGLLGQFLALPTQWRLLMLRISAGFFIGLFTGIVWFGIQGYLGMMAEAPLENKIGLFFASIALATGSIFFLYSFKYYVTLALVLGFSRHAGEEGETGQSYNGGLQPNLDQIKLERAPFVSIHLPMYNEKKVVDRLLVACTSMSYENYEVIVVDDSTDETTEILKDWQNHPRVKVIHRDSREGFKGGALKVALEKTDPRTEFVLIFDADFVPYPDTITQFLKYFQSVTGSLDFTKVPQEGEVPQVSQALESRGTRDTLNSHGTSPIAAVQGYQWHVLNKSENWITRGVRSEYAGSYVVERSGAEILGGLKQIAGSVYMIRKDILDKFGWQTSITEDFQLTLRLYEAGYKVVYTPYIQAPSECVSTIKRLVRQRMRWAEGHSYNVRKNFIQMLFSPRMTLMEKLEFLYLSPYYLQSALFLIGTLSWFISEAIFHDTLPFWTSLWGWSLVLTNMFALPLVNTVGLFLEESEERDYLGSLSFIVLSYLLVPFQAYASVKGFLEKEEGPWFRTPKTGKITDIFTRGKFYRWLSGIIPGIGTQPAEAQIPNSQCLIPNTYLALATANNQFNSFEIKRKRLPWLAKISLSLLLAFTTTIFYFSHNTVIVQATGMTSPLKLSQGQVGEGTWPAWGNYITNNSNGYGTGTRFMFRNRNANSGTNNYTWYTNLLPISNNGDAASVPAGQYFVQLAKSGNSAAANVINFGLQLLLTNNNGTSRSQILWGTGQINTSNAQNSIFQYYIGNKTAANSITSAAKNRLAFRIIWLNATSTSANVNWLINNSTVPARLFLPGNLIIPEISKPMVMVLIMVILPVMPTLASGRLRRPGRNIFEEFILAWKELLGQLRGEREPDVGDLPV